MKKSRIFGLCLGICVLALGGSMIAIATSSVMPHLETVEKIIPDAQIPR